MRAVFALCLAVALTGIAAAQDDEYAGPAASAVLGPVHKLPNGGRPLQRVRFPSVRDWASVKITLGRDACFGNCPVYRVTIAGDGTVEYEGDRFVAVPGHHTTHIAPETVHALFDDFAKAEFFWTYKDYVAHNITDMPAHSLALAFDGSHHEIHDYVGLAVGLPKAVFALEDKVDRVAGTDKWVKGTSETFASLTAEGWEFTRNDAAHLALVGSAAARGRTALVRQLLAAGVSAKSRFGCEGVAAAASYRADAELALLLLDAGAPIIWEEPNPENPHYTDSCDALASAASGGLAPVVTAILARHPDVNRIVPNGSTALMQAVGNEFGNEKTKRNYPEVVKLLIAAGADVNARNENGESPIMMVGQPGIARLLLQAGAKDVNNPKWGGNTVLMTTYDADVARELLEGGADPWLTNDEGRNALEAVTATYGADTSAVAVLKAWMATHPKPAP